MFDRIVNHLLGKRRATRNEWRFEPLYSLEQLSTICQWPIVTVLPFAAPGAETSERLTPGPGVGVLIANLLRRNLLLTRQISVIGHEDTSREAPPYPNDAEDFDSLTHGECDLLVHGAIHPHSSQEGLLELRALRRDQRPQEPLRLKFSYERVGELAAIAAKRLASLLKLQITPDVAERWLVGQPRDWRRLCQAAVCLERDDMPRLAKLAEADEAHPDVILCAGRSEEFDLTREDYARATQRDPFNSQLLFSEFITNWKSTGEFEPEAQDMLRRSLLYGPGHGKSQMCLPHVIVPLPENMPYLLAHSECGYRLLRSNSFALSNFSNYLCRYAPDDPRIRDLLIEAIELDRASPTPYIIAIDHLMAHDRPGEALALAQSLVRLCTPPLNQRTLYCFRQNPAVQKAIEQGNFDPLQFALAKVVACEALLDQS